MRAAQLCHQPKHYEAPFRDPKKPSRSSKPLGELHVEGGWRTLDIGPSVAFGSPERTPRDGPAKGLGKAYSGD